MSTKTLNLSRDQTIVWTKGLTATQEIRRMLTENYRVVVALLIKSTFSDILISVLLLCSTKSRRPSSPVR
ncbi:hypothetical protein F5J12DRAFT_736030 [Pisolithus orientalis]|uniref:uncharacterized protein n=1 Tax=Pisolithus orientalis TaxID=936130 RepID=UPI0022243C96|nr:uncharacterized protein F5J12DRAFT_736030 [Pisolithus orientalis]KAI6030603.1 hypothetical protein F5J12DRAFT_736030 [Pisolithus orientalis]